jgi:hypothetical protein
MSNIQLILQVIRIYTVDCSSGDRVPGRCSVNVGSPHGGDVQDYGHNGLLDRHTSDGFRGITTYKVGPHYLKHNTAKADE